MFKQYQPVELVKDTMSDKTFGKPVQLREGQRGIIVEIYKQPGLPIGYEVEFFDVQGDTIALMPLTKEMIRPVQNSPLISSKRSRA